MTQESRWEKNAPGPGWDGEVGEGAGFRVYLENRVRKISLSIENGVRGREESRINPWSFSIVPMEICSKH